MQNHIVGSPKKLPVNILLIFYQYEEPFDNLKHFNLKKEYKKNI